MSVLTDIVDAVVAALNAAELSIDFTAARRMQVTDVDIKDLSGLRLEVYPGPWTAELTTRDGDETGSYTVMVGVQAKCDGKKLAEGDTSEVDGLLDFVEEVHDLFRDEESLAGYADAHFVRTAQERPYSEEDLRENHVFVSVLALVFEVYR